MTHTDSSDCQTPVNGHTNGHSDGLTNGAINGSPRKVCVIGAGAAGLCAGRHLLAAGLEFELFEQTTKVGGTWNYTDEIGADQDGLPIHSSMYKNLRTNLPMQIMQFPDFPAPIGKASFVGHQEVLRYLNLYADNFQLRPFVKFRHQVTSVKRETNHWSVAVRNMLDDHVDVRSYDAVLVCNGRYARPRYPASNRYEGFTGKLIHSHDYREAKPFTDQVVAVLGAGPSGIDIAVELAATATTVYLLHQLPNRYVDLPENIVQLDATLTSAIGRTLHLSDGQKAEHVEALILATGYEYDFGFLDKSCELKVNQAGRVLNSYLHLINADQPTMAIWAIPQRILPFPIYQQQVKLFVRTLTGQSELPTKEAMYTEMASDFRFRQESGLPERHSHKMVGDEMMWDYDDRLSSIGKMEQIDPLVRHVYDQLHAIRRTHPVHYKEWRLVIENAKEFRFLKPGEK